MKPISKSHKIVFLILCLLTSGVLAKSQPLSSYDKHMSFGSEMIGKELTIINTYDEREMFYPEVPDTIWIKKVKKPKLDKHYTLSYIYKATQDAKWETPSQYVDGRTFLIKNIVYNEKEPGVGKSENR